MTNWAKLRQQADLRNIDQEFPLEPATAVATVKVRNALETLSVLQDLSVDPQIVLSKCGIAPEAFANPENILPYSLLGRFVAACVEASGCDDFGLRVGVKSNASAMGLTGIVSINSPTVRDSIAVIIKTLRTSDTGGTALLTVQAGLAYFGYSVFVPDILAVEQIEDASLAIAVNTMRQLCGAGWRPSRALFARKPPFDKKLFAQFFGAPLQFEAPRTCIEFDAATLDAPVRSPDPAYRNILAPLLEEALLNASPDFLSAVKASIRAQIAARTLSRQAVCRALGVSPRELARRLKPLATTYFALADASRYDIARGLLLKEKSLSEIASTLGFAEQSAFTRAFKAWSGTTPSRWRSSRQRLNVSFQ